MVIKVLVKIYDAVMFVIWWALLHAAPSANFKTATLLDKFGLPQQCVNSQLSVINQANDQITKSITSKLLSSYNNFTAIINCLVITKITNNIPIISINGNSFEIPRNIKLTDPDFNLFPIIFLQYILGVNKSQS